MTRLVFWSFLRRSSRALGVVLASIHRNVWKYSLVHFSALSLIPTLILVETMKVKETPLFVHAITDKIDRPLVAGNFRKAADEKRKTKVR